MTAPSAICTVNGETLATSGKTGLEVSASSTITIALQNTSGVISWDIDCTESDGFNPNSDYRIIELTKLVNLTNFSATFTAPAFYVAGITNVGAALQFTSTVNRNTNTENTVTFGVFVIGDTGLRPIFNGENLESNATFGVTPDINKGLMTFSSTGGPPSGAAGGDLSGTYPNPGVAKIQGFAFASGAPTKGQFVVAKTASTYGPVAISGDLLESSSTAGLVTVTGLQGNTVSAASPSSSQVLEWSGSAWTPTDLPSSLPPSGAAGGDLTGTYPNPTIQTITGVGASVAILAQNVNFDQTLSAPLLTQATSTTNSPGSPLSIFAQTTTAGGSTGGELRLSSGSGISAPGKVKIETAGTARVTISSTSVTLQSLAGSAGVVHNDSSGVLSSSLIVDADVSSSAAIAVSKLANSNQPGDLLLGNGSTVPTWTHMGGDASISGSGVVTVSGIQGNSFTSGSPTKGQFVVATSTSSYGPVTLSGDLSESSTTAGQVKVISLTGNAGILPIANTGNILTWAASTTAPGITQTANSVNAANAANMNITAQSSSNAAANGGDLILGAGTHGSNAGAVDGYVAINAGSTTDIIADPTGVQFFNTAVDFGGGVGVIGIGPRTTLPTSLPNTGIVIHGSNTGQNLKVVANNINFASFITSPGVAQDSVTTAAATGATLMLQAQNATGTGATVGGALALTSGTGNTAGTVNIQTGGVNRLNVSPTQVTIPAFSTGVVHSDSSGNLTSSLIVNADVSASAAIAYSKLNLTNSIVNADIAAAAAIAYSKLNLTGSIVNADISASAAIAYSKLNLTGDIVNADIATAAAIAVSKLASGTSAQVLLNNATPTPTWTTLAGDMTVSSSGASSVAKINGASVPAAGSLTTGNVLQVSGASALTYAPVNLAGGSNFVTGNLPVGNFAPGTSGQILMSNVAPATTWTTLSGDATISATGVLDITNLTGSSNLVTISATTLDFTSGIGNVVFSQQTSAAATASTLTIAAQTTSNGSGVGGQLNLTSGAGSSATNAGDIHIQGGGTDYVILNSGTSSINIQSAIPTLQWTRATSSPTIKQLDNITNNASGTPLTIQAQNCTGTTTIGANLVLTSGTGTSLDGYVVLQHGGTDTLWVGRNPSSGAINASVLQQVNTLPTSLATNNMVDLYATSSQRLGINGLGLTFANTVNATVQFGISVMASTSSGSGATGQQITVLPQVGQAATGASNAGGAGGPGLYAGATGGTSALAAGGAGGSATLQSGLGGAATGGTGNGGNGGDVIIQASGGGATSGGTAGTAGTIRLRNKTNDFMTIGPAGLAYQRVTKTANYTVDSGTTPDYYILCNNTAAITITLPAPTDGRTLIIKDIKGTAETNNVSIAQNASEKIENIAATYVLQQNFGVVRLTSDGTNWWIW